VSAVTFLSADVVSSLVAFMILIGFCVATVTDQWQLITKVVGGLESKVAAGYNNAMKLMIINRFGAILFFSSSAFYIESAGTALGLVVIYMVALVVAVVVLVMGMFFYIKRGVLSSGFSDNWSLMVMSFLANIFNVLGLTLPLIAGIIFYEYRLLLSNGGFFFNTIYTFIMVFYIESFVAKLIDASSENITEAAFSIIFGRIVGYIAVSGVFLLAVLYAF
jgi:hypothetical protein